MKKITSFIAYTIIINSIYAQVPQYNMNLLTTPTITPVTKNVKERERTMQYQQHRYDKEKQIRQNKHNTNSQNIKALIDWTYEIEKQTNDEALIKIITRRRKTLMTWKYQEDFTYYDDKIEQVEYEIKEAINDYNKRLEELNDPNKYWEAGNKDLTNNNTQSALNNFSKVIELAPDFAGGYYNRAFVYRILGLSKNEIDDLSKCIELEPNQFMSYHFRGWAKYSEKDFMGALSDFNKQIELAPSNAIAYYDRGSAKSELKDYYGAIIDYKKAIEIDNNYSMAYNNLAWSHFLLKKYSEALKYVNQAIEKNGKNYVAYDTKADILFALKKYSECISNCDNALQLNSNISNSYFLKGRCLYRSGFKIKACENWSKAGELGLEKAYEFISKYCNK